MIIANNIFESWKEERKKQNEIEQNEVVQNEVVQNEVVQNEVVQNEVVQNEVVQNEIHTENYSLGDSLHDNTDILNPTSFNLNGNHTEMLQNIIESLQGTDFDGLGKYELLANDSNFIKNKIFYTEWILKNTQLYQTKKETYFRCRCQHIINKGTKNERRCKKYLICSEKKKYSIRSQ